MFKKALSPLLKCILKMFPPYVSGSNVQTTATALIWDTKVYKGVIWNKKGRDEFGNMVISERDLTFYKSVTPINNRIMLQVPVKAISKMEINNDIEEQFSIEIEYYDSNDELVALSFFIIMDTEKEGQDVWNRIKQFRLRIMN